METMRALVYDRPSVCSVRDVPMPVCGEDEVVIKVMAASICKGADRRHHTTGHKLGRYPITTGHEFAGYIYQVGSAVTGWNVGDRVPADNAVPGGKSKLRGIGRGNHHIVIGKLQGNITAVRFDSIKEDILQHIIFVHRPQGISAELFCVRIVRFHFFCKFQQEKLKNFCELRVVNSFFSRYTFRDIVFADCEGTKARSNPISTLRIQKVQREQYEYFKRRTSVSRLWRQSHFS